MEGRDTSRARGSDRSGRELLVEDEPRRIRWSHPSIEQVAAQPVVVRLKETWRRATSIGARNARLALALLARLVENRACLQVPAPLVALCVLRGRSASRASPLPCAGIARLRRSAALLVASSLMIRASIQGYLAYRDRCTCHPNVVS